MARYTARGAMVIIAMMGALTAQQGLPAKLPTGPLVTFARSSGDQPHGRTVYVAACDSDQAAVPFWHNQGNVRVLRRLDQHRLLLASFGEPYSLLIVDTQDGSYREIGDGSNDLVAIHGDDVLYVGNNRWDKGDNYLYAASWQQPEEPRRLTEQRVAAVPLVNGNQAIAVTAGDADVIVVSLTRRQSRKIYSLPGKDTRARFAMSPGGQRLAIGTAPKWRGHLAVVDIGSGKTLREWRDLPLDLSPVSSFSPTLEVGFHDDEHVVCSETRGDAMRDGEFVHVRRSLETGKITDETPYSGIELYHTAPSPPGPPAPAPTFSVDGTAKLRWLRQAGVDKPLADVGFDFREGRIHLAPHGRYALLQPRGETSRCVLYRADKPPLQISSAGGHEFVWLPAADASPSAR